MSDVHSDVKMTKQCSVLLKLLTEQCQKVQILLDAPFAFHLLSDQLQCQMLAQKTHLRPPIMVLKQSGRMIPFEKASQSLLHSVRCRET
jgi:hypothetical protein